jgi:hypothetical protein
MCSPFAHLDISLLLGQPVSQSLQVLLLLSHFLLLLRSSCGPGCGVGLPGLHCSHALVELWQQLLHAELLCLLLGLLGAQLSSKAGKVRVPLPHCLGL